MRTTLRLFMATGVAALFAACGENPLQTTGPSPVAAPTAARHDQAGSTGGFRVAAQTPYSCPSDAPRLLRANSREDGDTVDLSWEGTPNVTRYTFEVEHLEGTLWMPAGGSQTYSTLADALVQSTYRATAGYGRYRVRVRNSRAVSCEELPNAQWSVWEEFSKNDGTEQATPEPVPAVAAIPEPVEPVEEVGCVYEHLYGFGNGYCVP